MKSLRYESCKADLDLWLKSDVRQEEGVQYFSYLLCYVDDILCIHQSADAMPEWFYKSFLLKVGFGNQTYT